MYNPQIIIYADNVTCGYLHFVLRDANDKIGKVQILAKIGKSKLKKMKKMN